MAKTIEFDYEGEHYILEFTRRTVRDMENEGFSLSAMRNRPMTMYPMLFAGAFKCHHKRTPKDTIDRIYKQLKDKEELAEALATMYNGALDTLFDEPEENEKNVEWKSNF